MERKSLLRYLKPSIIGIPLLVIGVRLFADSEITNSTPPYQSPEASTQKKLPNLGDLRPGQGINIQIPRADGFFISIGPDNIQINLPRFF